MSEYTIVTDVTTDLTPDLVEKYSLVVIPMELIVDSVNYLHYPDARNLSLKEFYDMLRKGRDVTTVQVNYIRCYETFEKILLSGRDILYISLSSILSGSCATCMLAAEELKLKYPERQIYVVDSMSASMGEGLLVCYAAIEKEKGMGIAELKNWVENNRLKLCHWFTVDDLEHLRRGGRLSAAKALVGSMLNIKPILHVDDNGSLVMVNTVRGRKKSLETLVERMTLTCENPDGQMIFISHGDCPDDADFIARLVREKFNVGDIVINYIGPVVGSHSGPGTVALFFLGSKR